MSLLSGRLTPLLKNRFSSTLLALLVMLLWGSLFPMIKLGYRAFGVDTASVPGILLFAGIRFALCGLILLGAVCGRDRALTLPDRNVLLPVALIALFTYVLHYTCTYVGVSRLESSKTAILKQIGTLFIACFAFLFHREDKFDAAKLLGGALGFSSILAVNLNGMSLQMSVYDLLVIAASFFSSAGIVFSKRAYARGCDPLRVTAWAQFIGGAILLLLGLALGGRVTLFTGKSALILLYMCFASCTAYALWNLLLKENDMSRLSVIKFTEALFSALCGWILLGENIFKWTYLLAFALACGGILVSTGRLAFRKR